MDVTFVPLPTYSFFDALPESVRPLLHQWGFSGLQVHRFRFSKHFSPSLEGQQFADAFFTSDAVRGACSSFIPAVLNLPVRNLQPVPITSFNLSLFDRASEHPHGPVRSDGLIRQIAPRTVYVFGTSTPWLITSAIAEALFDEDTEAGAADGGPRYDLWDEDERRELLFRIFALLVQGGGLSQPSENIEDYLAVTKAAYRELVSVARDESGRLVSQTAAFSIGDARLFPGYRAGDRPDFAPGHACWLLADMPNRLVTLVHCCPVSPLA
eukprot:gnl/Ergobibamus_cyprinoides/880.p1 GENE.gnl/Ergobibamus_cyprinoides/880~~gnl/Ergobibamus_cyprinoides/880.p1  ORF type:complete len:268 (+),score=48.06 gnl/Ergobibamus_cyprinoides/880:52-855(+)